MEFAQGATVGEVLGRLKVPLGEKPIVLINSRHAEPADPLKNGDVLAVFPPIAGG